LKHTTEHIIWNHNRGRSKIHKIRIRVRVWWKKQHGLWDGDKSM